MSYLYKIALSFAMQDEEIVEKVYHYLKAEGISVFYAPAPECQAILSGNNQREVFYKIFGLDVEYVALFVSSSYVTRKVPMEEASIAIAKHSEAGSVIPIYLDGTELPKELFNPEKTNYFRSNDPALIAHHLATKIKATNMTYTEDVKDTRVCNVMDIKNNKIGTQVVVHKFEGNINL